MGQEDPAVTVRDGERGSRSRRDSTARFAVIMVVFLAVVLPVYAGDSLAGPLEPLTSTTASVTHALIGWTGLPAQLDGAVISEPGGFSYRVHFRCTGILPLAILVVAILAVPATAKSKLLGIVATVPLLLGFNFARLVHLFHVGTAWPEYFELFHTWVWTIATVWAVAGLWLGWLWLARRDMRSWPKTPHPGSSRTPRLNTKTVTP